MNFERLWPEWSVLIFPHITNQGYMGTKCMCVKKKKKKKEEEEEEEDWAQLIKSLFNYGLIAR